MWGIFFLAMATPLLHLVVLMLIIILLANGSHNRSVLSAQASSSNNGDFDLGRPDILPSINIRSLTS
jgi:hypothetical protein